LSRNLQIVAMHAVLIAYTIFALFPVVLVVMNSFKARNAIFRTPYLPATSETFSMVGYETVFERAGFPGYFLNSLIITVSALILSFLAWTMAAHALSEYNFPGNTLLGLYMALGIMVPIRLGTVSLLKLIVSLNLSDTLFALILVYTASG